MKKQTFLYLFFLFLMISCSPQVEVNNGQNDETSIDNEEATIEQSPLDSPTSAALESSEEAATTMDSEDMNENEDLTDDDTSPIAPEETPLISRDDISQDALDQKSEPVTVDLSQLVTPAPAEESEPIEQPVPGIPNGTTKLLHDVRIDLSDKLGVDIDSIVTISVEEVMWRNSSLGCPMAGMSYLQVLTSGFRIMLSVDGETYHYHSRDTSNFILCTNPQSPAPGSEPAPGLGDT